MRIDGILIRKAKNQVRVSFSNSEKEPNLTQKKRIAINELTEAVELLKGKEVQSGGGAGFEAGWFDLLIEWPRGKSDLKGDGSRAKGGGT